MLIDIPSHDVNNFCENILKKEWPYSIFAYNYLKQCYKWKQQNKNLSISLLCVKDNIESGVFVGILKSGTVHPLVCIYALDNYEDLLARELDSFLHKWKGSIEFEGVMEKHLSLVQNILNRHSLQIHLNLKLILVTTSIENALKYQTECPYNIEIGPIREEHLSDIYELWVMNDKFTIEELENSLHLNLEAALGIYCKHTGELLCRAMRAHNGSIAVLQTLEKARNKGYAKLLVKSIAKVIAEHGEQPYSFTADFHESSKAIFNAIGLEHVCDFWKITASKNN